MNSCLIATLFVLFSTTIVYAVVINDANCGRRPLAARDGEIEEDEAKILGGQLAKSGDHPWQVLLLFGSTLRCGASIINANTVLTAAHCISAGSTASNYNLQRTSRRNPLNEWTQSRNVQRIVTHPSFSASTFSNDIALLFLSTPFDLGGENIGTICLSTINPVENQTSIASGWGSMVASGSNQNDLREVEMPITSETAVKQFYGNAYYPDTMLGAAYRGDGLDTCLGDSGGPLSVSYDGLTGSLSRLSQVGIASWGYGCGDISLYTRVPAYIDWITNQVKSFYDSKGISY